MLKQNSFKHDILAQTFINQNVYKLVQEISNNFEKYLVINNREKELNLKAREIKQRWEAICAEDERLDKLDEKIMRRDQSNLEMRFTLDNKYGDTNRAIQKKEKEIEEHKQLENKLCSTKEREAYYKKLDSLDKERIKLYDSQKNIREKITKLENEFLAIIEEKDDINERDRELDLSIERIKREKLLYDRDLKHHNADVKYYNENMTKSVAIIEIIKEISGIPKTLTLLANIKETVTQRHLTADNHIPKVNSPNLFPIKGSEEPWRSTTNRANKRSRETRSLDLTPDKFLEVKEGNFHSLLEEHAISDLSDIETINHEVVPLGAKELLDIQREQKEQIVKLDTFLGTSLDQPFQTKEKRPPSRKSTLDSIVETTKMKINREKMKADTINRFKQSFNTISATYDDLIDKLSEVNACVSKAIAASKENKNTEFHHQNSIDTLISKYTKECNKGMLTTIKEIDAMNNYLEDILKIFKIKKTSEEIEQGNSMIIQYKDAKSKKEKIYSLLDTAESLKEEFTKCSKDQNGGHRSNPD